MKRYYKHGVAFVAIALMALSLRHLAQGISSVTGVTQIEGVLMAIGIDCAMVVLELAALANIKTKWVTGLIVATCILSAGFNVLGFWEHAQGFLGQAMAVALGVFIPSAIYGLTDTLNRSPKRPVARSKAKAKAEVRKLRAMV